MLKIEHLSVNYGKIIAVDDISLTIPTNKIVALIGANGAGKTTTLMGISGVVPKAGGTVYYDDKDITAMPAPQIVRCGIQHIPEGRHIFPRMSVEENMLIGSMGSRDGKDKAKLQQRLEQQYQMFPRLKERRKQMGETLSGGEQQMLAIARGMMADPDLLMFDEPSLGLAPKISGEIFEMIVKIKESGKTVLLIEQNANMALSIADEAYVLETGRITMHGTGKELLGNAEVKKAYLGM
ncbi:MAG: ABC transporter ATP-binding protein [Faecousia sp.]